MGWPDGYHGHVMLAIQEMAEAMNLSAKALARRIAWHERLFQALGDVPEFRLAWWRCVKRTLQAQLTNVTSVKLQVPCRCPWPCNCARGNPC